MPDTAGPYADAAWQYRQAGWHGVIPIGRRAAQKDPPPTGYTGYAGIDPSGADVQAWCDGREGAFNIGLHIPRGVYVIDADERNGGVEGLKELERRAGVKLPPTITSTARGADSPSRHYLYRAELPEGRVWRDHPAQGLDSIHVGHRYAVTWPSVHPVTDTTYETYDATGELYEGAFSPSDLAELPAELIEECSKPGEPMAGTAASDTETMDVLRGFRVGEPCPRVTKKLNEELERISKAASAALHDPGALFPLVAYGIEGHAGVRAALSIHQAAYVAARVAHRGQGGESASDDWWRQVRGAVGKKLANDDGKRCRCGQKERHVSDDQQPTTDDSEGGKELPGPGDPMRVARTIVKDMPHKDGVPTYTWWRGDFYTWDGGKWQVLNEATVNRFLYQQTEHATYAVPKKNGEGFDVLRWAPTALKISNLRKALGEGVLQRDWTSEPDDGNGTVALSNGVFDLNTRTLKAATPRRFSLVALPFPYDPHALAPGWEKFLKEVTDGDQAVHDLIQEWFGYVLFGNTGHQKILYIKGPKRCGKGTINRVLHALLGPDATAAPSLEGLGGDFGMQSLIGKSLAVISDAQWGGTNLRLACERLLTVSGEDPVTIARKYQADWAGRLPTRFMMLSNDPPKPPSASGALTGRLLIANLTVSFYGREDPGLTNKLLGELPGIFRWSLEGYDRLTRRGYFVEPESAASLKADVDRGGSVVRSFVQDECEQSGEITLDALYERFRTWAERDEGVHVTKIPDRTTFARDLRSVVDGLDSQRKRTGKSGKQVMTLRGISLRSE